VKRKIEIFTAGCPVCDEQVQKIRDASCPRCDIEVLDVSKDNTALERSRKYKISVIPSVVINGVLADCCSVRGINIDVLKTMGLGAAK